MEKRFFFGLGILVLFLVLGLLASWGMQRMTEPVSQLLEQAADAILSGDTEQGKVLARKAEKCWRSAWRKMALTADHSPMDEIDGLFAQIHFYAQADEGEQLGACCTRVAELVEAISEAHALTGWNIL